LNQVADSRLNAEIKLSGVKVDGMVALSYFWRGYLVNAPTLSVSRWMGLSWLVVTLVSAFPLRAEAESPAMADSVLQAGVKLYSEGKYREVIRTFEHTAFDSLSAQAAYYVGASYATESDFQNAVRYLKRTVDLLPSHIGYRYQLARVLTQSGSPREGATHYEAIIAQDSTYVPALVSLGLFLSEGRDHRRAADTFARVVQQNPRNFLGHYYFASALVNAGEPDSAHSYLAACLTLNPAYTPALYLLASLYFKNSDYREALRLYTQASAQNPQNADLFYKMGLCHEKLQRYDRAAEAFLQATLLDSINSLYFARLGQSYFQTRKFAASIDTYQKAASLDEDNPVLLFNIGLAWAQMDSTRKAIDALNRAASAHHPEKIAYIYNQIGALHFNKKRYRSARTAYRKTLQFDPSNAEAQLYLALADEQLKNFKTAIEG
jgi:tetratricopeptide (TPR) repeat protein